MHSAPALIGWSGLPSSLTIRPSRFFATSPQPAGHSRHTVEKYAGMPGVMFSGGVTAERYFSGGAPQPLATAAPDAATILKNARRSIALIDLFRSYAAPHSASSCRPGASET